MKAFLKFRAHNGALSFEVLDHSVEMAGNGTDPGPAQIHLFALLIDRSPFIEVIVFS